MIVGIGGIGINSLTSLGGTKWSPLNLGASLSIWLDATDATSITLNGATVSQWSDKSGNNRHFSQGIAANQPTYNTTDLNGKPALVFDGSNDHLIRSASLFTNASNITIFAVAKVTTANQYSTVFSQYSTGNLGVNAGWQLANNSGALRMQTDIYLPHGMYGSTTISTGAYKCFTYRNAPWSSVPSTSEFWINGVKETSTQYGSPFSVNLASGDLYIGGFGSSLVTGFLNGAIGELIVCTASLSDADRASAETYLISKYGL